MSTFAGWPSMSQIIGSKKIGLGRIAKQVIASIDAGMKVRVDKTGGNETSFSVDLFIYRLCVLLADKFDPITIKNDDTFFDDLVSFAVKADDVPASDEGFHIPTFL